MVFSPCLFILLVSIVAARPVLQTRDVKALGPTGRLDQRTRWADAVGSATAVYTNGAARKNYVLHTPLSGPLSTVYKNVLRGAERPCKPKDGFKCEIGINSFGGVGEVQYDFTNPVENIQGGSTQVMVACKCIGEECNQAILIRPVNVFETLPQNASGEPLRRTCIYEAVGNGFTDCHAELLRTVRRPVGQRPEFTHGPDAFVYTVDGPSQSRWQAIGQRGWSRDCLLADVNSLPTATMDDLRQISQNAHSTPAGNDCKPDNLVQYFRDADEDAGEACYATYEYAAAAASQFGSQQDGFAIGLRPGSYFDPKPPLVSNTELALTCSAAGLGVLVLWGIYRTRRENTDRTGMYLFRVIVVQILSFMLESLPLHIALGQELRAREWESEFANVGGSLALGSDQLGPQGSAQGSVLVMTAVFGTVKYHLTRVSLVAGFTAAFDLIAFAIIVATLLTRRSLRPHAGSPQPSRPPPRFDRWMRFMRRYPPRELQKDERERLELARIRRLQIQNFGQHAIAGNAGLDGKALLVMSSGSTTSESSDTPVSIDIGAGVVPPIGHGASGADITPTSPPESAAASGDGLRSSQEGTQGVEVGNDEPNVKR